MAHADRKTARRPLLKAAFAGLGLVALILAVSWSKTWLYGVGAALLATSVATGLPRRPRNNTPGPDPSDAPRPDDPSDQNR